MGSDNPNLVIGLNSTGTHNIGLDTPLNPDGENHAGATYHVGIGGTPIEGPLDQNTDVFHGYAAGLAQQAGSDKVTTLLNVSPGDVTLSLDAVSNTLTASLNVGQVDLSVATVIAAIATQNANALLNPRYKLEFGGLGRSAFIDDNIFAAVEAASGSSVSDQYWGTRRGPFGIQLPDLKTHVDDSPTVQSYIVSADAIGANEVLFPKTDPQNPDEVQQGKQRKDSARNATFLTLGCLGHQGHVQGPQPTVHDQGCSAWLVDYRRRRNQRPDAEDRGTATYAGDAIGTVSTINGQQYTATGDLDMSWNFGTRSGRLDITDFDGKDFGGTMLAPGRAQFAGALTGAGGLVGATNGSFVGADSIAEWSASGDSGRRDRQFRGWATQPGKRPASSAASSSELSACLDVASSPIAAPSELTLLSPPRPLSGRWRPPILGVPFPFSLKLPSIS